MKNNNKSNNKTYYMPICMSIGLCIGSIIDAQNSKKDKDVY